MKIFHLSENPSVANHFIAELRSKEIQTDRMRFRKNLERLGEIIAYEISRSLQYQKQKVATPLGVSEILLTQAPVLATVLRAGLPFLEGFLNYFDQADTAFIGACRGTYQADGQFEIESDYMAAPSLEGRTLIIADPMLATGKSLLAAYRELQKHGQPAALHIACVIASQPGLDFIQKNIPEATIWAGCIDTELNSHSYIVPGLGDAGDLSFGQSKRLQKKS